MSIQQSVNQAISGSLFLLNQTDAFQRMKAIKSAKREMEVNTEIGKMKGEGSDASQEQADEVNANAYIKLFRDINGLDNEDSSKEVNMVMDMYSKLQESIAEAEQARKNSEEFRKMVLQGVYRKEDRWDGK